MPWRGPEYPGELPTLGWWVLDWFAEYLIVPDGPAAGEPLTLTDEQAQFILNYYVVDPRFTGPAIRGRALHNARLVRRAMLSRAKGWGKSPILAALNLVEALGDVVLDGWDANGEPVGRPWTSFGFKAKTQIVAVSEDQTANTWDALLEMAAGPLVDAYDVELLKTMVNVPRGVIEFVTSAALSREGFRPVFAAMDQTESWTQTNGGVGLASTIRRNLAKMNGSSVETPNAFQPGLNSVAERTWAAWRKQQEGRTKIKTGILVDHREMPPDTDPTDRESLLRGLAVTYGDSADVNGGWVPLERVLEDWWDPDTDPQEARQFYGNQVTHATDSWVSSPEWAVRYAGVQDPEPPPVADRDVITLGFDGSRGREQGVTDATALIGCRLEDGQLLDLGIWEQPSGWPPHETWAPPEHEVDAAVHRTFGRFTVVGFYADPTGWDEHVARWEARYADRLKVKAGGRSAVRWPKNQTTKVATALKSLHTAIVKGGMCHDGSSALTQHVINARRRPTRGGVIIAKEHPSSPKKIDAAYAGMLAWQARLDAIAAGVTSRRKKAIARRVR